MQHDEIRPLKDKKINLTPLFASLFALFVLTPLFVYSFILYSLLDPFITYFITSQNKTFRKRKEDIHLGYFFLLFGQPYIKGAVISILRFSPCLPIVEISNHPYARKAQPCPLFSSGDLIVVPKYQCQLI